MKCYTQDNTNKIRPTQTTGSLVFCIFKKKIEALKKSVGRNTLVITNVYNVARSCNGI